MLTTTTLSRRARIYAGLLLVLCLVAVIVVYFDSHRTAQDGIRIEFKRRAELIAAVLEKSLEGRLDILRSIVGVHEVDEGLTREEFRKFVARFFATHPDLHGLGSVAVVPRERRAAYEQAARASTPSFEIKESDGANGTKPAAARDIHYVVHYLEPAQGNEGALGFDLASEAARRQALEQAAANDEIVATAPIRLIQETGTQTGLLIYAPVFRRGLPTETEPGGTETIHAYAAVVFRGNDMVNECLATFDTEGIAYSITDVRAGKVLCATTVADPHASGLDWSRDMTIAGRDWRVTMTPTEAYLAAATQDKSWLVLVGGVLLTVLLFAFLLSVVASNSRLQRVVQDRRRTQSLLLKNERRFRAVFQASAIGIVIADADARVLDVNTYAVELLGRSRDDVLGSTLTDLAHPQERDEITRALATFKRGPHEPVERVARLVVDDRVCWAAIKMGPIRNMEGEVDYFIQLIENVTDKHQLEREVLRSQKLESIGLLAGGIAHDFNNILTAISGNVSLSLLKSDPKGEAAFYLHEVENALQSATGLTQQLLTFAKGGEPVREPVDIRRVLVESATFALRGSGVRCEFRCADDLQPALADSGQINQVINNLVVNAANAMNGSGVVRVSAANAELGPGSGLMLEPGRYVHIAVTDTGDGIPEDIRERVFDPYFTTKPDGTGLGLATAFSIVRRHGGDITVESTPGCGTTFRLFLPVCDSPVAGARPAVERRTPTGQGRILIMDDDEMVRSLLTRIVASLGYEVCATSSGEEAVARYVEALRCGRRFDVVVLDLTVPGGMGGLDAIGLLLDMDPHVTAIVSSGYSADPILANYRSHGFCGVVQKPYDVSTMAHALQDAMRDTGRRRAGASSLAAAPPPQRTGARSSGRDHSAGEQDRAP